MRVRESFERGVQIFHVVGDFDCVDGARLHAHIDHAIGLQHVRVVLDGEQLGELTSSGLVAIVRASKRLQEHGGGLVVARLPEQARDAFHVVGLDRRLRHFDTVDDAILHFDTAVTRPVSVLGALAATARGVDLRYSFVGPGQVSVVGAAQREATMTAINLRGVAFHPRATTLMREMTWLFAYDVPLWLSFSLRVDATLYPVATAGRVASFEEPSDGPALVVARFSHLLVADRVVIEMVLHSGSARGADATPRETEGLAPASP